MEKHELIENVKDQDVLNNALQNGHTAERHENKSLSELLERALTEKITGASAFLPNVDKNALIRDALVNNADKIIEWLETAENNARFGFDFCVSDNGNTRTVGNGFKRDDNGFVEPRKTDTMFLLLESDNENETLGFNIKTAFPDLKENFELDGTIDPLKVLKETELYQNASIIGKLFYETHLGESIFKNNDALIKYELAPKEVNNSENSINNIENDECIYLKYRSENEREFLYGQVSEDGIEVAKKDESGRHVDWIMGTADEEYIPLNNDEAIQKFKGYCPRMYELLDNIKGKLDARLEMENIRNNDAEILNINNNHDHANKTMSDLESKAKPNITFDSMKEDKAKKDAENRDKQKEGTRTEEEKQRNTKGEDYQAPENSIPSRPSGGGGPDDR